MRTNTAASSLTLPVPRHKKEIRDPYDGLRPWSAITHGAGAVLAATGTVDPSGGFMGGTLDLAAGWSHGSAQKGACGHARGRAHEKGTAAMAVVRVCVHDFPSLFPENLKNPPLSIACPENLKNSLLNPVSSAGGPPRPPAAGGAPLILFP